MKDRIITFKRGKTSVDEILKWHQEGYTVVCPLCKSKLLFLDTYEKAAKHNGRPGIFCPKNDNHYATYLWLSEPRRRVWNKFKQWKIERDSLS